MGDIEWRRVFLVSSSIFALLLICGSLYLHVQQKNHFGRLRYSKSSVATNEEETSTIPPSAESSDESGDEVNDENFTITFPISFNPADGEFPESVEDTDDYSQDFYMNDDDNISESLIDLFDQNKMVVPMSSMLLQHNMSESCLHCICETITGCMPSMCLGREPCGIFRISRSYWVFAGKPLLDNNKENEKDVVIDKDSGYLPCVNNVICAARTVLAFINNYARDCNGDGIIDCQDHIELHLLGFNCMQYNPLPKFHKRVEQCLNKSAH